MLLFAEIAGRTVIGYDQVQPFVRVKTTQFRQRTGQMRNKISIRIVTRTDDIERIAGLSRTRRISSFGPGCGAIRKLSDGTKKREPHHAQPGKTEEPHMEPQCLGDAPHHGDGTNQVDRYETQQYEVTPKQHFIRTGTNRTAPIPQHEARQCNDVSVFFGRIAEQYHPSHQDAESLGPESRSVPFTP